jgi:hypothetical protein
VPGAARTTGGAFVGRTAAPFASDVRVVGFALHAGTAGGTAGGTSGPVGPALDRAALLYFRPEATGGWDPWDVTKLAPLASAYATVAFGGERDGGPVAKAQESRPFDGEAFEVPLQVEATGMGEAFVLSWPHVHNVPAAWALSLRDLVTGEVVDLREASAYAFTVDDAVRASAAPRRDARPRLAVAARAADRFVLRVERDVTADHAANASGEPVPAAFALRGAAPNPFGGTATLRYEVPAAARVTIAVYDLLGRRVATLFDGASEAGYHAVSWDARGLASGVYVVRMHADTGFAQTQRVTLLR